MSGDSDRVLGIAASNGLAALDDSSLKPKFSDRKFPQ